MKIGDSELTSFISFRTHTFTFIFFFIQHVYGSYFLYQCEIDAAEWFKSNYSSSTWIQWESQRVWNWQKYRVSNSIVGLCIEWIIILLLIFSLNMGTTWGFWCVWDKPTILPGDTLKLMRSDKTKSASAACKYLAIPLYALKRDASTHTFSTYT